MMYLPNIVHKLAEQKECWCWTRQVPAKVTSPPQPVSPFVKYQFFYNDLRPFFVTVEVSSSGTPEHTADNTVKLKLIKYSHL